LLDPRQNLASIPGQAVKTFQQVSAQRPAAPQLAHPPAFSGYPAATFQRSSTHSGVICQLPRPLPQAALAEAQNNGGLFPGRTVGITVPNPQFFLAHRLPLVRSLQRDANLAENSMRPVALGRRNWIHIGSPRAGPKVAAILSVVETCRRLKVSVRDYSAAILPGLADLPIQRLPALTPSGWASYVR